MDPFIQRQSSSNHSDETGGENSITAPLRAAVPEHRKPIPKQMDQNHEATGQVDQNHNRGATGQIDHNHGATGQDYQLRPQSKIEGAAYQYQQKHHYNEGKVSTHTHPAMPGGSFSQQVPQGSLHHPRHVSQVARFSRSVIQPNPTCGSNFYLPPPNMFPPKQDYFPPPHAMFPTEQSGFISPSQLPFPTPRYPFMPGLMSEYHLPRVKSEHCLGSSSMPPSVVSETGRDQSFIKNFGVVAERNLNERNNNVRDESEFSTNFQRQQSKQMGINSFDKIASIEEDQSPNVKIQDDGSNKRFKAGTSFSQKGMKSLKTENIFIHSVTNTTQANSIPPKLSIPRAKRQTKTSCPKPRSTPTLPKRKANPSDLSTAPPFKLTSPTPISPEQLEATRMKMVFSPKLTAHTPCSGCIEHKSLLLSVSFKSSPVNNQLKEESSFGEATRGRLGEANATLNGVLCQMCGEVLGLDDAKEIHNVSYLTGDSESEESVFDDGPLGNIKCAQTSLAVNVKKAVQEIITISDDDDDDIKIPIGQSRRTMQFKGKQKQGSDGSRIRTTKKAITRPFACNVCSKTYIREHALKAHVKIHLSNSSMKVKVESIPDENKNTQIKENSIPDSFIEKGSITESTIEKSSIPDDKINELLISSDDEASPPIFISKQRSTIKKQESMQNSNTLFENQENFLENEEDSSESPPIFFSKQKSTIKKQESMQNSNTLFENQENFLENEKDSSEAEESSTENEEDNVSQELTGKIVCPQIMKESARNEMVAKNQLSRSCWYCLAEASPGPWQVHRYEPNKYLCSKCFDMHKANAEKIQKKEQQEKLDKKEK